MVSSARGRFITLEGGEGAGKSTQIKLLAAWLRERGIDVVQTREPGGAPGAERIRELLVKGDADRWTPIAETLLHFAARADHLERTIRPALAAGRWVICDRFADSTTAYQGYGHGVPLDVHRLPVRRRSSATRRPISPLILDLPVEQGLQRAAARAGHENRYEQMAVDVPSPPARRLPGDRAPEPAALRRHRRRPRRRRRSVRHPGGSPPPPRPIDDAPWPILPKPPRRRRAPTRIRRPRRGGAGAAARLAIEPPPPCLADQRSARHRQGDAGLSLRPPCAGRRRSAACSPIAPGTARGAGGPRRYFGRSPAAAIPTC